MIFPLAALALCFWLFSSLSLGAQSTPTEPPAGYRFVGPQVKYETLDNKGLTAAAVYDPAKPKLPCLPGREIPQPSFDLKAPTSPEAKTGTLKRRRIAVTVAEENGVARTLTPLRFGFPLPKGGLFDVHQIQLLDADNRLVPAQYAATSRWDDGSLKWVLIDTRLAMKAQEKRTLTVEAGVEIARADTTSPLTVASTPGIVTVSTGPLKAVIDTTHFNVLREVYWDRDGDGKWSAAEKTACGTDGVRLVDEKGRVFTTANAKPDSSVIEEQGPERVVVRVKGRYADATGARYMAYTTRLIFQAGSPRVVVQHTHLDDYLETEFTDITSLTLPLVLPETVQQSAALMLTADGKKAVKGTTFSVFQTDDRQSEVKLGEDRQTAGRFNGAVSVDWGKGGLGCVVHEFWQRWPKSLQASGKELVIGLLPEQPSAQYGTQLPPHLMFPFVSGKYRFKWGMSFTQRVTLDFSGRAPTEELVADANQPLIAIVPSEWYSETQALGFIPAKKGRQFAEWDARMERSFEEHKALSERQREYGFFNYGDWWAERTRNWGNNEYDLAAGFFWQFARTGKTDYYRSALAAARHQADVDIVHAYPDPYYRGANHQHSIGHTGTWEGPANPPQATWSHAYDIHTDAQNGHTWARGMTDAWFLAGEAHVMEAALELGEHITWAMAPNFKKLGTHERSAGWSLLAILDLYRLNYDPAYLQAAERIANVTLKAQSPGEAAAWPHVLPKDHSPAMEVGNSVFLIGILMDSLKEYYRETQKPEVLAALRRGGAWLALSWDENLSCWPYSATTDGRPASPHRMAGLNPLIIGSLSYLGRLDGNAKYMEITEKSLRGGFRFGGPESIGKELAELMVFTDGTLYDLDAYYQTRDAKRGAALFDGTDPGLATALQGIPPATEFSMRGPRQRTFYVRLGGGSDQKELKLSRAVLGSARASGKGVLTISDTTGKTVTRQEFDLAQPSDLTLPLVGPKDKSFKVLIEDNDSGAWSLRGEGLKVVMSATPGMRIGHVGTVRYAFYVPKGTTQFQIHVTGVHHGGYGMAAIPAGGTFATYETRANPVGIGFFPGEDPAPPAEFTKVVKPRAEDTGKMWSLALWASADIACDLQGVPPWVSLNDESWFDPQGTTATGE